MNRLRLVIGCVVLGLACTWCEVAQATDLTGCWSGSWRSCQTGHKGVLNATFTKCGDDAYSVHFRGRFFKIMPFRYTVTLRVVEETEEGVVLQGSSYLGRLAGTFNYRATVTDCKFVANYSSCKDSGLFTMTRCCP